MRAVARERDGAPATVMVVEDDALIRGTLEMELEEAGFTVLGISNADAALRAFAQDLHIVAVVTDVRMPGLIDGMGLAGWMRDNAPGVPVILVSGYPMRAQLLEINPAIALVVRKPYDPNDLVGWISSLLLLD